MQIHHKSNLKILVTFPCKDEGTLPVSNSFAKDIGVIYQVKM